MSLPLTGLKSCFKELILVNLEPPPTVAVAGAVVAECEERAAEAVRPAGNVAHLTSECLVEGIGPEGPMDDGTFPEGCSVELGEVDEGSLVLDDWVIPVKDVCTNPRWLADGSRLDDVMGVSVGDATDVDCCSIF